jgi:hypothetical protein
MKMEGFDWVYMAQGRDGRRTLLETLEKFWIPQKAAIFWLSEGQSASDLGTCCMRFGTDQLSQSARQMTNGI